MGPFLVAVVGALASGLVLLVVLGRYREAAWFAGWDEMLSHEGRQRYEELRERFARELAASQFTYQRARDAFQSGDRKTAARLLEGAHEYAVALAADREQLLRDLARCVRMLGAVAPLPPLRPDQFQHRELAALVFVGWLPHYCLVTPGERLRLRLRILRRGRTMLLRAIMSDRAKPGLRPDAFVWTQIDAARADLHTLDREALECFRALLTGLAGTPQAVARP